MVNLKCLLPMKRIEEIIEGEEWHVKDKNDMGFICPMDMNMPISIEQALIYGEVDRFYFVVDPQWKPNSDDNSVAKCEIVSLHSKKVIFDRTDCMLVCFKTWSEHFKF